MKKKIILCSVILIIALIAFYLTRSEWKNFSGSDGHYSKETYLEDGYTEVRLGPNYKVKISCIINSGKTKLQIAKGDADIVPSDFEKNIVFEKEFDESFDEWVITPESGLEEGNYVLHWELEGDDIDIIIKEDSYKKIYNYQVVWDDIKEFYCLNIQHKEMYISDLYK